MINSLHIDRPSSYKVSYHRPPQKPKRYFNKLFYLNSWGGGKQIRIPSNNVIAEYSESLHCN